MEGNALLIPKMVQDGRMVVVIHLDPIFHGNVSHDDIKNHIPGLWELFIGKSYFSHACHICHPHLFPLFTFMLVVFFSVSLWLFMVIG